MSEHEEERPPPSKKPKTIREQCQRDLVEFKELFSTEMDTKFARLEQLILGRPAGNQPDFTPQSTSAPPQPQTTNGHQSSTQLITAPNQSNETVGTISSANLTHDSTSVIETRSRSAAAAIPASTSNVPPLKLTSDVPSLTPNVNINNPATWMLPRAVNNPVPTATAGNFPLSSHEFEYDQDLESRVNHILAATAHQFSANNGKPGIFPHRFVSRGPDRRRPAFNTLSLSEYVWGITRIIRDAKVPSDIKPLLYNHIEDIMEDACQFEWASAVRPWSEEIFTRVAEDRLTWDNRPEIQLLRMSMARNPAAKIVIAPENTPCQQQYYNQQPRQPFANNPNANANDIMKGGPPCEMYNSQQGCTLQSGHFIRGKRMIHVCRYCLFNTSAAHPHPETACRNRVRSAPATQPHF